MKQVLSIALASLLFVTSCLSQAQGSQKPESGFQQDHVNGMEMYKPDEFYFLQKNPAILQSYFPEMKEINGYKHEDLKKMSWAMAHRGISFAIGLNPNFSNYFDLYGSYIGINPGEPAAIFGYNERAEVGHFHFPTHDAIHLYIAQIGMRKKHLENPELARKQLIDVLLKTEGLASAWTSWDHVKRYWDWRNETVEKHDIEKFESYNKGVYFLGNISRASFTDFVMSNTVGDFTLNYKTTRDNIEYEHYMKRQEAQVPQVFDVRSKISSVFKKFLGSDKENWSVAIEKFLLKHGKVPVALGTALNAYFREGTGYKGFLAYANIQADFYMQPWYVEWSDLFSIGDELSLALKEIDRKVLDYKEGRFAQEVQEPAIGITETMQLRSNVSAFGRKLVELKFLSSKLEAASVFNSTDVRDMEKFIENTKILNDQLLQVGRANKPVSLTWLLEQQKYHRDLVTRAEKRFPVEKYLPVYLRLPHAQYSHFWTDPLAVVMPRPKELTTFLSSKGIANKAREYSLLKEKMRAKGNLPHFDTNLVDGSIVSTNDRLAAEYMIDQIKASESSKTTSVKADYQEKLRTFHGLLAKQINDVFLPQVLEAEQLNMMDQKVIFEEIKTFESIFSQRMAQVELMYTDVFVNLNKDPVKKSTLFMTEANLAISSHVALTSMWNILNKLNIGKSLKDIQAELQKVRAMSEELTRNNREVTFNSKDYWKLLVPIKGKSAKAVCSYITRFCLMNQNLTEFTQKEVIDKTLLRKKTNLIVRGESGVDFNSLPRNAVIVLVSNHDYGILDGRLISKVAESLGIKKSLTVIDTDIYPHLKVRDNKDQNLLQKNEKFFGKVLEQAEKFVDGRISMNIFPEGVIQYWGSQFPRTAKWGAFAYARRAAEQLKGKKEVYIVEVSTNALDYITSGETKDLVALVKQPVRVPDAPMSEKDEWTGKMRLEFEKSANQARASKQIDLIDRGTVKGTNIPRASGVRDYYSPTEYLNDLTDKKMSEAAEMQAKSCSTFFPKL